MTHRRFLFAVVLGPFVVGLCLGTRPAFADDDVAPQELRRNAVALRDLAERLGVGGSTEQTRAMEERANLLTREAEYLRQLRRTTGRIAAVEKAGDADAATRLRNLTENLRAQILELQARRREVQLIADEKQRNREKLRQLGLRAASLRDEGRFSEADEVDEEIKAVLRVSAFDPELKRVDVLKQQAVEWQLAGRYDDAMLLQREAARLLANVKRRAGYRPDVERRVDLLTQAADMLMALGESETSDRVFERIEQIRRESTADVAPSPVNPQADECIRRLRADVDRLGQRLDELTRAIDALMARDK
jgi:hypothetical protein